VGLAANVSFAADDDHAAEVSSSSEVHAVDDGHADAASHGDDGHAGGHAVNTNPLSVDPDLAIVTAIIFVVLMAVLWKFAWGPISEALAQRENAVAENIAEAQRQNDEAKRLLAEHETQLTNAAAEVKQLIEDAKRDAETQKQSILAEAQAAASAEKNRAIREIDSAKNAALQSLAEKSVDTAVGLAGKIVSRQLSSEDHSQLINETLQNFPSEN
jgi:F-type H+-transporting ATPase subunit b